MPTRNIFLRHISSLASHKYNLPKQNAPQWLWIGASASASASPHHRELICRCVSSSSGSERPRAANRPGKQRHWSDSDATNHQRQQGQPRRVPVVYDQIEQLDGSSRQFLENFPHLNRGEQISGLVSHLMRWRNILSDLEPSALERALPIAHSLARLLMEGSSGVKDRSGEIRAPNNCHRETPQYDNEAHLVTSVIHGWAKLQSYLHHSSSSSSSSSSNNNNNSSGRNIKRRKQGYSKTSDEVKTDTKRQPYQMAEELLLQLEQTFNESGSPRFQPLTEAYSGVLDAMGKSPAADAPNQAIALFERMMNLAETGQNPLARPSKRSWNAALNALATHGDAEKTMKLLRRMEQTDVHPDAYTYGIVTKAWLRSGRPDSAQHVRHFLDECIAKFRSDPSKHPLPNEHVFVTLIKLYERQPEKAQGVLDEMLHWNSEERCSGLMIHTRHFVPVMNAWAKAGKAEKVEALLLQQQELYEAGNEKCKPQHMSFVVVIDAWSKRRTQQGAEKAESILRKMEDTFLGQPHGGQMNSYGYNLVLDAYGQCGNVEKTQEIFQRMEQMGKQYNNKQILPDTISYTSLMRAFIKEGRPGFADRVESLLGQMEHEKRLSSKPDTITYGCVLNALSKSGVPDAAKRAEAVLERMKFAYENGDETVRPNEICFNTLMNIYAKLGQPEKAEATLLWMEESARSGNDAVRPTGVAYGTCMDGWARVENSKEPLGRAFALFDKMVKKYRDGDRLCKPQASTFSILFLVLAKSLEPNRLPVALALMREMEHLGVRPTTISCNSFLAAVSGSTDVSHEALKECIMLFHAMRRSKHMLPDSTTYQKLLYVCSRLMDDEEEQKKAYFDLFNKCCHDGKLDDSTLELFRRFLSDDLLEQLNIESMETTKNLPAEWSRYAKKKY